MVLLTGLCICIWPDVTTFDLLTAVVDCFMFLPVDNLANFCQKWTNSDVNWHKVFICFQNIVFTSFCNRRMNERTDRQTVWEHNGCTYLSGLVEAWKPYVGNQKLVRYIHLFAVAMSETFSLSEFRVFLWLWHFQFFLHDTMAWHNDRLHCGVIVTLWHDTMTGYTVVSV